MFCLKIAIRQIAGNKRKSITIFLCLFLSIFLLINLFSLYQSYEEMILEDTKESYGAYHFFIKKAKTGWKEKLQDNPDIEKVGIERNLESLTMLTFNQERMKENQILRLCSMDNNSMELSSLKLKLGRFPQNEKEIILSAGIEMKEGYAYDIASKGGILAVKDEKGSKTDYLVVGILDNFNAGQMDDSYIGLTKKSLDSDNAILYVTVKENRDIKRVIQKIGSDLGIKKKEIKFDGNRIIDTEEALEPYRIIANQALINLESHQTRDDSVKMVEYTTKILVVFVVLIAALIIWNIYMILLDERKKEYGLLLICGSSSKKIYAITCLESSLLFLVAVLLNFVFAKAGKKLTEVLIQSMRISSMEHLEMKLWIPGILLGVLVVMVILFLLVILSTKFLLKKSPIELLNDKKGDKWNRRGVFFQKEKYKKIYEQTAECIIGVRNVFRKKISSLSLILSLGGMVLFFVTFCSFLEVVNNDVVKDITMIPPSQYVIDKGPNDAFSKEFIDSIPFTEFKYTLSSNMAQFNVPIEIKNKKFLEHYADYYPGQKNEDIFNQKKVYMEVDGISQYEFEELEWFDGEKMTYEEWVKSGKALLGDIAIQTQKDGTREKYHLLNMTPGNYKLSYDGINDEMGNDFLGGTVTIAARVGVRLYAREDNLIYFNIMLPEDVVREKFVGCTQCIYINARKGKEIELGAWLRKNRVKYNYTIMDDVKKYAAAYDTHMTTKILLVLCMVLIAFVCMFHIYNTIRGNMIHRKKEISILLALGMTRFQIQKSVLWEHAVYGIVGGLLGGLFSIVLLRKLLLVLSDAAKIKFVIPWDYLAVGFCGAILINMIVAFLATLRITKTGIVEGMKEND